MGINYGYIRVSTKEQNTDRQKGKDLTGQFIADLVLQILSYVAQTERENIRQRQAEGIAAAKQRGVHFGNVPKALPAHFSHTVARWRNREISLQEACSSLQVSRSWFYKKVKEMAL